MNRIIFTAVLLLFLSGELAYSQTDLKDQEVVLTFNYPVIGRVYVGIQHNWMSNESMIPVSEVFSLLGIYHEVDRGNFSINGFYLEEEKEYRIDFKNHIVTIDGAEKRYDASKFRITDKDYYLAPEIFEAAFGLKFEIDINTLLLNLETDQTMPVVLKEQRQRRKEEISMPSFRSNYYPLQYDRKRSAFELGFLDYSLSSVNSLSQNQHLLNYTLTGGIEFLGGDVQGTHLGTYSFLDDSYYTLTRNLRWRYVFQDNPYISQVETGQIHTGGLLPRRINGISVTNNPVEPRQLQSVFLVDGTTTPNSEIELYLNNQIIGYTIADNLGYYKFEVPLTYGTSQLRKQIYTPDGRRITDEQRIQTPFQFLPPGVVSYEVQGGRVKSGLQPEYYNDEMAHVNVGAGLTNWLTAKVGAEYIEGLYRKKRPFLYSSFTGRIYNQYLLNVDIAPEAFYRLRGSVIYPSSRSLTTNFTYFRGPSIYNVRGADHQIEANYYTPLKIGQLRAGFRLGGTHYTFSNGSRTRYNSDLYLQIDRVNLRFNYRDDLYFLNDNVRSGIGQLRSSLTYLFPRSENIPKLLQGTHFRFSGSFERYSNSFREANLQVSKNVLQNGRIYLNARRDFRTGVTGFQAGISIDIKDHVRSSTDYRGRRGTHVVRQNFRGSIGYDDNPDKLFTNTRDQVGRAAASVILFVDNNQSGTYDEGDEILPYPAVNLDRSAFTSVDSEGVLRLTQLQSYYRYNMQVDRSSIPNPTLVPQIKKFSFIADPNQYKRIEIPFYRSGVLEGSVSMLKGDAEEGLAGIRMLIKGKDHDFEKQVRSFYGGGFFVMDLPPGRYTIEIDSTQLNFLNATYRDTIPEFEIRSLPEGDYIGDMNIHLVKNNLGEAKNSSPCTIQVQAGSYKRNEGARKIARELTENLATEFNLYFNAVNELYGVRTVPQIISKDSLNKDFQKILTRLQKFRKGFPAQRFVPVIRCSEKSVQDTAQQARYLISLAEFPELKNAQQFSTSLSENYSIATVIRKEGPDSVNTVLAGPFTQYDEALKAQEKLIENQLSQNPTISIDKEAANYLNFAFLLYSGSQDSVDIQAAFPEGMPEKFSDIKVSDLGEIDYNRLFEGIGAKVGTWDELLRLLQETSGKPVPPPVEIIIFEKPCKSKKLSELSKLRKTNNSHDNYKIPLA